MSGFRAAAGLSEGAAAATELPSSPTPQPHSNTDLLSQPNQQHTKIFPKNNPKLLCQPPTTLISLIANDIHLNRHPSQLDRMEAGLKTNSDPRQQAKS
jgi:hypothetical protein